MAALFPSFRLGVDQDEQEALKWYRKAADQGYAVAQFKRGICFHEGEGVTRSYEKAAKWFQKAADQGHADAQCCIGAMLCRGQGGPVDFVGAREWFRKAATQGRATPRTDLGRMHADARGQRALACSRHDLRHGRRRRRRVVEADARHRLRPARN